MLGQPGPVWRDRDPRVGEPAGQRDAGRVGRGHDRAAERARLPPLHDCDTRTPGVAGCPRWASSSSTACPTSICGPTLSEVSDCGTAGRSVPLLARNARTASGLLVSWWSCVSLATCNTTGAAAAVSGAEAEVPPSLTTLTALADPPNG